MKNKWNHGRSGSICAVELISGPLFQAALFCFAFQGCPARSPCGGNLFRAATDIVRRGSDEAVPAFIV
jgi:hypothetical protein